jgi:dihydrofolate synthase/folylpolyglutamate synthase
MYSLRRFGIKLGLDVIRSILQDLNNPHQNYNSIHIAGTNGKGSIASALSSVLRSCGYRVGLYTSPHLVHFNERICINNQPIPNERILAAYNAVKHAHHGDREPTFFEYTTAMAFHEFKEQGVDWAVIETGMGGRLDATNILTPAISIITNLSIEHREYLGHTLVQIAQEKGGIIKREIPLVTGVKQKSALQVLEQIAHSHNAPVYRLGRHFRVRRCPDNTFNFYGRHHRWLKMQTSLSGNYQIDNAGMVLAACEILSEENKLDLPLEGIRAGLKNNRWPGRLEVVSHKPYIILDGAHNLIAARNLAKFLADRFANKSITLVVGILDDKPYKAILETLLAHCDHLILTRPTIDRALAPETLYETAQKHTARIDIIGTVEEALRFATETVSSEGIVCVAGSLYVVGEAKEALDKLPIAQL